MKGDDLKQVREQNWKTVNSMSEEQIRKYQQTIMNEMPAGFIAKLRKNKKNILGSNQQKDQ